MINWSEITTALNEPFKRGVCVSRCFVTAHLRFITACKHWNRHPWDTLPVFCLESLQKSHTGRKKKYSLLSHCQTPLPLRFQIIQTPSRCHIVQRSSTPTAQLLTFWASNRGLGTVSIFKRGATKKSSQKNLESFMLLKNICRIFLCMYACMSTCVCACVWQGLSVLWQLWRMAWRPLRWEDTFLERGSHKPTQTQRKGGDIKTLWDKKAEEGWLTENAKNMITWPDATYLHLINWKQIIFSYLYNLKLRNTILNGGAQYCTCIIPVPIPLLLNLLCPPSMWHIKVDVEKKKIPSLMSG